MAKEKNAVVAPFFRELFQLGVYKRSQGRIARQVTFATLALAVVVGAWQFYHTMQAWRLGGTGSGDTADRTMRMGIAGAIALLGVWICYRVVNLPSFADFLIAVEAEMNKVSWPSRGELVRSCIVVIFSILFLTAVLFVYDIVWIWLFQRIGVMHG